MTRQHLSSRALRFGSGLLFATLATVVCAQQPAGGPPTLTRGTVEKIDKQNVTLKGADGTASTFAIAPKVVFATRKASSLAGIKPGDFVASAAVRGADGKLHSTELRIFPEALRGAGEGQRPMNEPNTMMTNATVSAVDVPASKVEVAPTGRVLKVKFQGGDSELVVGPEVKIVALTVADIAELKPGTNVTVASGKAADGSAVANVILVN
jgi:hypothetical protein